MRTGPITEVVFVALLTLRTYALWDCNKRVLWPLTALVVVWHSREPMTLAAMPHPFRRREVSFRKSHCLAYTAIHIRSFISNCHPLTPDACRLLAVGLGKETFPYWHLRAVRRYIYPR